MDRRQVGIPGNQKKIITSMSELQQSIAGIFGGYAGAVRIAQTSGVLDSGFSSRRLTYGSR